MLDTVILERFKRGEYPLLESSLSRVVQHIENPKSKFAVISPYRGEYSPKENQARYQEMKNKLRKMNLGFIEMIGGYKEEGGEVIERSFFIPNMEKKDAIRLGNEYGQYSVLYKDTNDFQEIGTNDNAGVGEVKNSFRNHAKYSFNKPEYPEFVTNPDTKRRIKVSSALKYTPDHKVYQLAKHEIEKAKKNPPTERKDVIDTTSDNIKQFFSALVKGKHAKRKFLFQMERVQTNWMTEWRIHSKYDGDDSDYWNRII